MSSRQTYVAESSHLWVEETGSDLKQSVVWHWLNDPIMIDEYFSYAIKPVHWIYFSQYYHRKLTDSSHVMSVIVGILSFKLCGSLWTMCSPQNVTTILINKHFYPKIPLTHRNRFSDIFPSEHCELVKLHTIYSAAVAKIEHSLPFVFWVRFGAAVRNNLNQLIRIEVSRPLLPWMKNQNPMGTLLCCESGNQIAIEDLGLCFLCGRNIQKGFE